MMSERGAAPGSVSTGAASCCSLYCAVLTEYRIKGKMWKTGWFSQERSVKECERVWWNVVVVTPDQWLCTKGLY